MACQSLRDEVLFRNEALLQVFQRALEHLQVGIFACDAAMYLLAYTPIAAESLAHFPDGRQLSIGAPLPGAIADVVNRELKEGGEGTLPVRVESPDGAHAVYLSSLTLRELPGATVCCLRREAQRESELRAILQKRYGISTRDFQIIALLRRGHSNKLIATTLGLTENTAKTYVYNLFETMGVHSRVELLSVVERIRDGN